MTVQEPFGAEAGTRVIIVDDHPAVRLGLLRVLSREAGFVAVAAVSDARSLLELPEELCPDVVVVDYDLARGDGLWACNALKQRRPAPGVVIYSAYAGPALTVAATVAQADALVHKADAVDTLLHAIRRVAAGERLLRGTSSELMHAATARVAPADLPIVAMLVDGARIDEIADTLRLGPRDGDAIDVGHRVRRIIGRLRLTLRSTDDA